MFFKILPPARCIIKLNKVKQVVNAFPMFSLLACKMTGRSGGRMPGTVAGWKYFPPRTNIESTHLVFSFYFQFFVWGFLLDKQFLFWVDWLSFSEYWQGRNKAPTENYELSWHLMDACMHFLKPDLRSIKIPMFTSFYYPISPLGLRSNWNVVAWEK